jgi:DNA-directed RNA polymerase subunit E'/Rpb7
MEEKTNTKLKDLYIPMIINERDEILPKNLHNNIDELLLNKIKNRLGNKCSKHGYINKDSIKLIERTIGKINSSHFNGNVIFDLKLEVDICKPAEGDIIEVKVIGRNKMGILAQNLPMIVALSKIHHDDYEKFDSIQQGQTIKVKVIDSKFQLNDSEIHIIARLF